MSKSSAPPLLSLCRISPQWPPFAFLRQGPWVLLSSSSRTSHPEPQGFSDSWLDLSWGLVGVSLEQWVAEANGYIFLIYIPNVIWDSGGNVHQACTTSCSLIPHHVGISMPKFMPLPHVLLSDCFPQGIHAILIRYIIKYTWDMMVWLIIPFL